MQEVSTDWTAARNAAALFDISNRGQVEVAGLEAVPFLHNLCTNDIKGLAGGSGCEFFLTTNKAKVIAHGFAHRLLPVDPPTLWLDLDPGTAAKTAAHLNHFIVSEQVEVTDRSGAFALFHLCGPQAISILTTIMPELPTLGPLHHFQLAGCRITRHDRLELLGFDIAVPGAEGATFWQRLLSAGAVEGKPETFNILRVEAGVPVDGVDMDSERFVVEVGRIPQAICYTKGCYLGQEPIVMARDRGHPNRALLGIKVDATVPLQPGSKVTRNSEEVGQVTSSVWSPLAGLVIAQTYLKRGSQEVGTAVEVEGKSAVVSRLPFAVS